MFEEALITAVGGGYSAVKAVALLLLLLRCCGEPGVVL